MVVPVRFTMFSSLSVLHSFACCFHSWAQVPAEKKQELIDRKLWLAANMTEFRSDMKREYFASKKKR
jgi:hypothetical protein